MSPSEAEHKQKVSAELRLVEEILSKYVGPRHIIRQELERLIKNHEVGQAHADMPNL